MRTKILALLIALGIGMVFCANAVMAGKENAIQETSTEPQP